MQGFIAAYPGQVSAAVNSGFPAWLQWTHFFNLFPKQVKWIEAIEFVHDFAGLGGGRGGYNEDHEFYGRREPI